MAGRSMPWPPLPGRTEYGRKTIANLVTVSEVALESLIADVLYVGGLHWLLHPGALRQPHPAALHRSPLRLRPARSAPLLGA